MDRDKLAKIMAITQTSAHEGEMLSALRRANAMLTAAKLTWPDVILRASAPASSQYGRADNSFRTPPSRRGTYGAPEPKKQKKPPERVYDGPGVDIASLLDQLGGRRFDLSTAVFVSSVREFFEANGFLTKPQFEAIQRMAEGRGSGGGFRF